MTYTQRKRKALPSLLALFLAVSLLGPLASARAGVGELGYPLPDIGTDQIRGDGRIDDIRMEEREVVIGDRLYRFLTDTEYYTSTMGAGSIHLLLPGTSVGYITNPQGEILKIWLLE